MKVDIAGDKNLHWADSGIYFRSPFALATDSPWAIGYEAQIQAGDKSFGDAAPVRTGSLSNLANYTQPIPSTAPGEWFTLEIIARGNRLTIKVNGLTTVDAFEDASFQRGHFALQQGSEETIVFFKKIEIKELPASSLPPAFKNSLGMEFVLVPKGKSWLGGGKDKPGDKEVEIAADFYLGKYEVTQEEWATVMGDNPSHFSRSGGGMDAVKDIPEKDLKRFPVENVNWDQIQSFTAKLNDQEKDSGWVYRLPREIEWEYACRGGPMTDKRDSVYTFFLDTPTNELVRAKANFQRVFSRPCRVGTYQPNNLGLWDMHGNVWEWCHDKYANHNEYNVPYRGGCWDSPAVDCGASFYYRFPSQAHTSWLGLRLARVPSGVAPRDAKTPPAFAPFTDADVHRISALPIAEQYAEVCKELRKRNPEYTAAIKQEVRDGQILGLEMQHPGIRDLSPVRALPALERVEYSGRTLEDISCLQGMRLFELSIRGSLVSDLSPLKGMPLKGLECTACSRLTDLSPLDGMPLTEFQMAYTPIKDLRPLRGMKLQDLNLEASEVSDLSPLAGMPLTHLGYRGTRVTDISALKGMPLKLVTCDFQSARDAAILRSIKTLGTINGEPAAEFWERFDKGEFAAAPLTDADLRRIAALPVAEQIAEVRKELMKRNPDFNGSLTPTTEFDLLTGLEFFTDNVTDISVLRALPRLTSLNIRGNNLRYGQVRDLSPLQKLPLTKLYISVTVAADLTFVRDMPLTHLYCDNTGIRDLQPVAGKSLQELNCSYTQVSSLEPLRGMPLSVLWCNDTPIADLKPLVGMRLIWITLQGTKVTDLSPLRDMPLTKIYLDYVPERDRDILRSFPDLQMINDLPAAEFWQKFAAGANE